MIVLDSSVLRRKKRAHQPGERGYEPPPSAGIAAAAKGSVRWRVSELLFRGIHAAASLKPFRLCEAPLREGIDLETTGGG
jgi:hypothetical protein